MARGTRPRGKRIEVWLTEQEYEAITANASRVKQAHSEFLRNLGIGFQPKSRLDQEAIQALMKLHADQGRLGGLLKLWLSERKGEGTSASNVRSVLQQIESLQMQLGKLVLKESSRL
jgi:hypothetical protein